MSPMPVLWLPWLAPYAATWAARRETLGFLLGCLERDDVGGIALSRLEGRGRRHVVEQGRSQSLAHKGVGRLRPERGVIPSVDLARDLFDDLADSLVVE